MKDEKYLVKHDEKYVVFKYADFWEWRMAVGTSGEDIAVRAMVLDDAVVIRTQDVFAAPALDAYANSIRVASSILNGLQAEPGTEDEATAILENLSGIADHFHERAVEAWQRTDKKLPD